MPMVEDFPAFFQTSEFAVNATVAGLPVVGIFDAASQRVIDGMVIDAGPQLTAASTDVASAVYGTAVVVAGTNYTVTVAEPDGTGITVLQLRKA
jgi:hypothetical protein